MRVGSLFAGIGGFDLGFERAGFDVSWCVEIDRNARAVLARRFPNAQIFEDIREVDPSKLSSVDVICGGFPCQDLSVAGKRAGLAGERSGLFHDAMRIVRRLKPKLLILENVPGLLSSNRGLDFATVLREVGEGWHCAEVGWRVLDSQYFGVAQRRRRVFVVAGSRIGCAEEVLALSESCVGDPPARGEARQGSSADAARCADVGRQWPAEIAPTLNCAYADKMGLENQHALNGAGHFVPQPFSPHSHYGYTETEQSATLQSRENRQSGSTHLVAQALGTDLYNGAITGDFAATMGTPGSSVNASGPTVMFDPVAFRKSKRAQTASDDETWVDDGLANTLNGFDTGDTRTTHAVAHAFYSTGGTHGVNQTSEICPPLKIGSALGIPSPPAVCTSTIVRRLTPVECERLQGFPDGWTDIGTKEKPTADSHRYKQLGNAVTVNVAEWLAKRAHEALIKEAR